MRKLVMLCTLVMALAMLGGCPTRSKYVREETHIIKERRKERRSSRSRDEQPRHIHITVRTQRRDHDCDCD